MKNRDILSTEATTSLQKARLEFSKDPNASTQPSEHKTRLWNLRAPYTQWGKDLDPVSIEQLENACRLPITVAGALMPDAHVGYGLPIGGVLATENAVIPYAVGVDIACRMKLSVLDLPINYLETKCDQLKTAILEETRFGIGSSFRHRRNHKVMDLDWAVSPVTRKNKDKAWSQLGTSGSGNHFVEFGVFSLEHKDLGLEIGKYLALLSHSGSRGVGAQVASYYSKLAKLRRPTLPKNLRDLAWLSLTSATGNEYWNAMMLMGEYASANHCLIHQNIIANLGASVILEIENHHNFAWKETHNGNTVIIHRKGATPAASGDIGIIPGTMATPAYVVRGKGHPGSLNSAAHGAGRLMSRRQAKKRFSWKQTNEFLAKKGVTLISAGLDEVPMAYKNIDAVMNQQRDLVDIIAQFDPKLVKMAPPGERPED